MEPIFLKPIFKEKIWSGKYINDGIGEIWSLCVRDDNYNLLKNSNKNIKQLYNDPKLNKKIFGDHFLIQDRFPILLKFLSVSSKLSVQVHPNDEYAKKYNDYGKMEVWYVAEAGENACVAYGLKDVASKGHLLQILQDSRISDYINIINIKKGDIIPIYPGTIHALIGDMLIFEIQQNSDLTFRLYDWNRKPDKKRPLHIKESFDVIDLKNKRIHKTSNDFSSELFSFEVHGITSRTKFDHKKDSCIILSILKGTGELMVSNKNYTLNQFDTIIIPACISEFEIQGDIELVESWI